MIPFRSSCVCVFTFLLITGCGGSGADDASKERLAQMAGGKLAEVVPVGGKVLVDGEAKAGVNLYLYSSDGSKLTGQSRTDSDGTYCWSTSLACDGIEAGSYRVAFRYIPKEKKNDSDEKALDLFKSRYSNPMKVEYLLTVAAGTPQPAVNYELKVE